MDSCYQKKICNCVKHCNCEEGYECCSENVPDGKPSTFGLCVSKGTCDKNKGICSKKMLNSVEHFSDNNKTILSYDPLFFSIILFSSLTFIILYLKK
jgi:hypothetical protein